MGELSVVGLLGSLIFKEICVLVQNSLKALFIVNLQSHVIEARVILGSSYHCEVGYQWLFGWVG